jgi:acetolactate synthase-1/2/3 large subunit
MADHFRHKADLILGVGCSFTRAPYAMPFPDGKVMIHITLNEGDINKEYPTEYPLIADAKLGLQALIDEIKNQTNGRSAGRNGETADELKGIKDSWMAKWLPALTSDEKPINPYRVIWDTMHSVDRRQTIATHEAGYPRDQMVPFWQSLVPNTYLGWGKTTQLGTSMGMAMGAKLASPDKQVIALQGDAAIGMCGMEIETAVRERIPVTIIVLNNSIMTGYSNYLPVAMKEYGIGKLSGDYAKLAESLGAYSERVEEPSEIKPAMARAARQNSGGRAALIECMVSEYAHTSPE